MRPSFRPRFKKSYHDTIEPRRRFLYEVVRAVVAATPTIVTHKVSKFATPRPAERLVAHYAARLV